MKRLDKKLDSKEKQNELIKELLKELLITGDININWLTKKFLNYNYLNEERRKLRIEKINKLINE